MFETRTLSTITNDKQAKDVEEKACFGAYDVFCAAKAGNLNALRYFIEERGVDVNARYHDATPLYYASLCGHYHCVVYLLEKGANCAENTYDGDRCLYGALTLEIRDLLKEYATRPTRITFFAREIGNARNSPCISPDSYFLVDNKQIPYHKCILAMRIKDFEGILKELEESKFQGINYEALDVFVNFCYGDVIELPKFLLDDFRFVCEAFHLKELIDSIKPENMLSRRGRYLVVSPLERIGKTLSSDLRKGYLLSNHVSRPSKNYFADVVLDCNDHEFHVHSVILASRSAYFETFLSLDTSRFCDRQLGNRISFTRYMPNIIGLILEFLYTDEPQFDYINCANQVEEILEVLDATNMLLLPVLQAHACKYVIQMCLIGLDNVYDWLDVADLYDADILRSHCIYLIGELFLTLPLQAESVESATEELLELAENNSNISDFVRYLLDSVSRRDPRQEKAWHKKQDENESCADFLVAEVREAMIENVLCTTISMSKRSIITDSFEAAAEIWIKTSKEYTISS